MREISIATVYRHYKGNYYYVSGLAQHTENGEILVIYHALYGECDQYARPMDMFLEEVPDEDQHKNITGQKYRFQEVEALRRYQ